jgi:hypothetical protein
MPCLFFIEPSQCDSGNSLRHISALPIGECSARHVHNYCADDAAGKESDIPERASRSQIGFAANIRYRRGPGVVSLKPESACADNDNADDDAILRKIRAAVTIKLPSPNRGAAD